MIRGATAIIFVALFIAGAVFSPSSAAAVDRVSLVLASDTETDVIELFGKAKPAIIQSVWPTIAGAKHIWVESVMNTASYGPYTFRKSFDIPKGASELAGSVEVTSDNAFELLVNGQLVGKDGYLTMSPSACLTDGTEWKTIERFDLAAYLKPGVTNTLDIRAVNYRETVKVAGCNVGGKVWGANPAMLLFKADVSFVPIVPVEIKVLNPVQLDGKGSVGVAILQTATFDPLTVDPYTVCFGSATSPESRDCTIVSWKYADANGDGGTDLVLRFEEAQTGLAEGDTTATLTGETFDGSSVEGTGAVLVRVAPGQEKKGTGPASDDKDCNEQRNADGTNCGNHYGQDQ